MILSNLSGKFVLPGDFLGVIEEFMAGDGTYEENGRIFSAITGVILFDSVKRVISVVPVSFSKPPIPVSGDVAYGYVFDVNEDSAIIRMCYVEGKGRLSSEMTGFLRFPYVSLKVRFNSMFDVVRIGDIVRVKVLNSWLPFQVSTRGDSFGVIFARCSICLSPLVKRKGKLFCNNCKFYEPRKLASDYGVFKFEEGG